MKDRKYTLQVAPEDCTGCTLCVRSLPGQEQERSQAPRHQHGAAAAAARNRSRQLGLLPEPSRNRPQAAFAHPGEGRPTAPAAVRVLRRLLRLRRNAVHQADDAAVRRPRDDRQRHRLLLDLRRQPAHHALLHQRRRPRTVVVQLALRRQRRVRSRACAWRSTSRTSTPANWSGGSASQIGEELAQAILNADQKTEAGHLRPARARRRTRRRNWPAVDTAGSARPAQRGRCPGQEERLDRRRRRLGLRHRLRRPRSRARQRPQRQRPGARYRGLLQHRRPGVQVHAARRGRQVRRRRQADRARRTSP